MKRNKKTLYAIFETKDLRFFGVEYECTYSSQIGLLRVMRNLESFYYKNYDLLDLHHYTLYVDRPEYWETMPYQIIKMRGKL